MERFPSGPIKPLLVVLLSQAADVGDQVLDLRIFQLAFISGHLAFALGDDVGQLRVGFRFYFGRCEVSRSHLPALPVSAVTHRAFCFVRASRILGRGRCVAKRYKAH